MSVLLRWPRKLWEEGNLDFSLITRHPLGQAKQLAKQLMHPYAPLYQLEGENQGGPLTVSFLAPEVTRRFYSSLLFTETPSERKVGQIPFWNLAKAVSHSEADMVIIEADTASIARLPTQGVIVLPRWVKQMLDISGSWEDVVCRFRKNTRTKTVKQIYKYGYEYEISRKKEEFELFYHSMYLPTVNRQFGELSAPVPYEEACQHFEHGQFLMIKREGRFIAGSICRVHEGVVVGDILGVLNADQTLLREHAQTAVYYSTLHWSNQNGYKLFDLQGSKPFLNLGVVQHKRQWGAGVVLPQTLKQRIWIKFQRKTPAVVQFLKDNPCIVTDKKENLYGLIVTETPNTALAENETEWLKKYEMPGLKGLLIRSMADLMDNPVEVITQPEPATSLIF